MGRAVLRPQLPLNTREGRAHRYQQLQVLPAAHDFVMLFPLPHTSEHAAPFSQFTLHFVEPEQLTVHPPTGHVTAQSALP